MPTISKIQTSALPTGSILQMKYTQLDTPFQVSGVAGNTETFVTGMSVVITPTIANSIIRLESVLFQEYNQTSYTANTMFYFTRNDTTKLYAPVAGSRRSGVSAPNEQWGQSTDADSTPDSMSATYFDSTHNSTSALTYKFLKFALNSFKNNIIGTGIGTFERESIVNG